MSTKENDIYLESTQEDVIDWNCGRIEATAKSLSKKVSELDAGDLQGVSRILKCTSCFKENIRPTTITFYSNDGSRLKCWDCQNK